MIWEFIKTHEWIVILSFYLKLAIIVFINRKKFQVENKFILIYKTKFGINFINKFSEKHKESLKLLGYCAIGIGFVGMLFILGFFVKGLYELIFVPGAPPTMSLVIPGVKVPGSPIVVPFWYGIIGLFIVVLFHEFGHGVIAKAHGMKIQSTGIVFFGPIIGAFVEPDEKNLKKQQSTVQNSVFAAGPFFNVILAGFALLILFLIINPLVSLMIEPAGVSFSGVQKGYPAEIYGLEKDTAYTQLNGVEIKNSQDLLDQLSCVNPNETLTFSNNEKNITLITASNPNDASKGYLGVSGINSEFKIKSNDPLYQGIYYLLYFLMNLFQWVFMLSLGIGLANLLPLGPVDGGRMLLISLTDIHGEKKGTKIWSIVSIITFVSLIILVLVPIIKSLIFKI